MSNKEEQFRLARKLQDVFRETVKACMEGDLQNFSQNLEKLKESHDTPCTYEELIMEFHSEGKTLFHIACSSGKEPIVRHLLERVPKSSQRSLVNLKDHRGFTPLINATISESSAIMETLLLLGADASIRNEDGAGAIHFAAGDGSVERVQMLHKAGADLNTRSKSGSPLHWAASKGHDGVVKYLLENGCDANDTSGDGVPAVLLAAVSGSDSAVTILVEAGADVGAIVTGNLTTLHICAEHGLSSGVKSILTRAEGLNCCNVRTNEGNTPLHLAAMSKHREIMKLLLPVTSLTEQELPANLSTEEEKITYLLVDGEKRLKHWESLHGAESTKNTESSAIEKTSPSFTYFDQIPDPKSGDPNSDREAERYKGLGNDALKAGNNQKAVEYYSSAIESNKYNAVYWSNRSAAHMNLHNYDQALIDAEISRRLKPDWPKACFRLATARLALRQFEDAALAAFEGCKLDPSNKELKALLQEAVKQGQEDHQATKK